jgi:sulfatase maturation enzyme AslB (radical SAM superfamily)
MLNSNYKAYWMVTNRCNLRCDYCVLEDAPHQLKAELDLNGKKELVTHLYHKLGFLRLTLSGGEVLIFGKHPPSEFIELLRHIRSFRSTDREKNLEVELYTNGTYLDENVANEMKGVVDLVAVTIDSTNDNFLSDIGRNHGRYKQYYEQIVRTCGLISNAGIKIKLHSVIGQKNHLTLPDEVTSILDAVQNVSNNITCWKFYQYMSYDAPLKDHAHAVSVEQYAIFKERVELALKDCKFKIHFKDNKEMNASLFNILSHGNAQYMRANDSWTTSQRTEDLRTYNSMTDLFAKHDIDEHLFRQFHEVKR